MSVAGLSWEQYLFNFSHLSFASCHIDPMHGVDTQLWNMCPMKVRTKIIYGDVNIYLQLEGRLY